MDKKVVFLDVDGTMVNEKGEIPESAQYAVRTAQANGHRMVVCSGRSRFQIYDALLELGFSGIVGGAGAFVEDEGKEFYHAYIDEEHRKSSFDYLESNGFLFCYQADDGVVLNQRSCDGMLKVYRDAGMSKERLDRLIGRMHLTEEPWKNEKNEKIIYYGAPFPVAKVHADMEPYFDAVAISLDGMGDFAGEIGINGINKATGGHPSKRTYQAIRIELNRELDVLENSIDMMIDRLNPQGRLCIITFHSLEDRIVKARFRNNENPCTCPPDFPMHLLY